MLERHHYPQPVVVTRWLAGSCGSEPPTEESGWTGLIDHFTTLHEATLASICTLPAVVLTMRSVAEGLAVIAAQCDHLPVPERPIALIALARQAERQPRPNWPAPRLSLCRGDPNISNFIARPGAWASVDWEYAGLGDPAFEIADLVTHPAYGTVARERWEWVIERYCARSSDRLAALRIRAYIPLMLVWWVGRFARMLYEVPRGLDARLVARPHDWAERTTRQYERYLARASAALAERW